MIDPQEKPDDKLFSGSVAITVYLKVEEVNANDAKEVADEAVKALQHTLRNEPHYDNIELESHDIWEVDPPITFWDMVDDAYDAKKHDR